MEEELKNFSFLLHLLTPVNLKMEDNSLAMSELRVLEDRDLDLCLNISNNINTNKTIIKNNDSSSKGKQHLKPKVYVCDFCSKKFPTCQALGGHQNGHKAERAMMKRRRSGQEQSPEVINRPVRYDSPINRLGYYQPLSSSNIINTQSMMSNHYDPSRAMIDNFRAYRGDVRVPSKAPVEEEKSVKVGVDLNLKLWF